MTPNFLPHPRLSFLPPGQGEVPGARWGVGGGGASRMVLLLEVGTLAHGPFFQEVGAGGEGGFWPILEESQDFRNTFRVRLWGRSLPERETGMAQSGRENTESSMPLRLVAIFCLSQCAKG